MGILFSIAAAICFSLSHISVRQGVSKLGVAAGTAIMLVTGTVTTLILALIIEGTQIVFAASIPGLLYFALAGLIHFNGGWGFMNASASRIGATRVSAMTSLTPLFAAIFAFFTLDQKLNGYIIIGILLIVIGIYTITTSKE
jgi:drug/metabolite transporter (DMT)-like permease